MTLAAAVSSATARWSMDETGGTRVDYLVGNNLTVAIFGGGSDVGSSTGKLGNAANFVASDGVLLNCNDSADVSFGDEAFTALCWINFTSQTATRPIFSKGADLANAGQCDWALYASGGTLTWRVSNGSSFTDATVSAPSDSTWGLVVVTHDPTANQISISLNAGTRGTASYSAGMVDNGTKLYVGGDGAGARWMDGLIDELIILRYVFSTAEESEAYNSGNGIAFPNWTPPPPPTIGYIPDVIRLRGLRPSIFAPGLGR